MSIPPFPSQDLAKLVLGYLAEEQLMTAYDEFLQASPYLDALRNEYDRIFMTSLKSILAEYRAVKIYVDTCKPFALRKKIFQYSNLLDVVKFLVANVDINKILLQEAADKASLDKQKITITPKPNGCELCHSLSLAHCVCKSRQEDVQRLDSVSASYVDASTLQSSVETTHLADLPGSHIRTKKKNLKLLDKDSILLNSNVSSIQNSDTSAKQSFSSHISPEEYLARCENSPTLQSNNNSCLSLNSLVKVTDPSKSNKNIEEFNSVMKSVVNKNKTLSGSECSPNQRISHTILHTSTFQDFASGVSSGERQSATYNVPDSSTSEKLNVRAPIRKDVYKENIKGPPQCQLMLQVTHVNDSIKIPTCREEISQPLKPPKSANLPKIQPKPLEKTIKIISDVKVGNNYSEKNNDNTKKKLLVPKNATSTPLMQMQTIMINGTPAYKHTKTQSYTKDEIMAMPTLIVVPASGPSQTPTSAPCEPIMTQNSVVSEASQSPQILGPLVIDVPISTSISSKPTVMDLPDLGEQKVVESGLVKTVYIKNNNSTTASVPKDNVISMETNTPQVLPPTRKSSSTPRRSSHIRVLDFTTPRRILHETIDEQVPSQTTDPPAEIDLTGSPNVVSAERTSETIDIKNEIIVVVNEEGNNNDSGSTTENEIANKIIKQAKKYGWDADLRALIANDKTDTISHRKPKTRTKKKKKSIDKIVDSDKPESQPEPQKKIRNKKSPRVRKPKIKYNIEEMDDEPPPNLDKTNSIPCKPTIKIICGNNCEKPDFQEGKVDTESIKNKSHDKADDYNNTPEAERLSLQNVIGAKLNISDLLETPYKQALYDIQMETPRFLGPDLPDEPLSDIKIMNIPTPRFLNTPNPVQATPSSYSSRPTDYSSGGSYYKPDDHDYMPIPDIICPVTSSKEDVNVDKLSEKDSDEKKSRPVRKCTKNVSYYKNSSAVVNKPKEVEDNVDATSSCSDTISVHSSIILQNKKELTTPKTPGDTTQSLNKTGTKKRNSTNRKRQSPKDSAIRDKTKSFMKIKPRYTPKKTASGRNTISIQSLHSKGSPNLQKRKRTTSKEKLGNATPVIVSVQTKSRRKSSTPRKLNCTKSFNCESSGQDSPENISNIKQNEISGKSNSNTQDSDTEQLALRWSDNGSQDNKPKDISTTAITNEIEDINKIQQFIDSSVGNKSVCKTDSPSHENINARIAPDGTLQRDLMKRGFDLETAKIIERDLLDDTPLCTESTESRTLPISIEIVENKKDDSLLKKTAETDSNITNELQIVQDETDDDEIELSVHECNESSNNYFVFEHDDTKEFSQEPPIKLKDNFTMEICIDDVTMRLRATSFNLVLDQDPVTVDEIDYSYKETELAVNSINIIDRLYTPLKDSVKAQCYEIFDSTLTSIDTPLKAHSPVKKTCEASVTELVIVGELEAKEKTEAKKRKRVRSGSNEPTTSSKRTRQDADLLLKTANIQNIDIETVLTKLHGH